MSDGYPDARPPLRRSAGRLAMYRPWLTAKGDLLLVLFIPGIEGRIFADPSFERRARTLLDKRVVFTWRPGRTAKFVVALERERPE